MIESPHQECGDNADDVRLVSRWMVEFNGCLAASHAQRLKTPSGADHSSKSGWWVLRVLQGLRSQCTLTSLCPVLPGPPDITSSTPLMMMPLTRPTKLVMTWLWHVLHAITSPALTHPLLYVMGVVHTLPQSMWVTSGPIP